MSQVKKFKPFLNILSVLYAALLKVIFFKKIKYPPVFYFYAENDVKNGLKTNLLLATN